MSSLHHHQLPFLSASAPTGSSSSPIMMAHNPHRIRGGIDVFDTEFNIGSTEDHHDEEVDPFQQPEVDSTSCSYDSSSCSSFSSASLYPSSSSMAMMMHHQQQQQQHVPNIQCSRNNFHGTRGGKFHSSFDSVLSDQQHDFSDSPSTPAGALFLMDGELGQQHNFHYRDEWMTTDGSTISSNPSSSSTHRSGVVPIMKHHHSTTGSSSGLGGSSKKKVSYSLNDFEAEKPTGLSELEQLFANRKTFNSLSKKYSTDNLIKEQHKKNRNKAAAVIGTGNNSGRQGFNSPLLSTGSVSSSSLLEPTSSLIRVSRSTPELSGDTCIDSFQDVKKIIQSYYEYETFMETTDGREELRQYLTKRHNEELLLMLETRIAFLSFYDSDFYNDRRGLLKVKEFQMIYNQFIDTDSQFCMNIDSAIRNKFVKLNPRVAQVTNEDEAIAIANEIDECLDVLHFSVTLQMKTEIFSQFKKTEEFQTFILSKIIELQGKKAWDDLERQSSPVLGSSPVKASSSAGGGGFFSLFKKNKQPQNSIIKRFEEKSIEEFLIENELSEYCSQFKKKKLNNMSQIQDYTCEDYLKVGVVKGSHQARLVRLVGQYFRSYCKLGSSLS
ncbi:hypothetical protein C9374_010154 [Naegleria lovaniensis]|uniref:RGS domain-containing protein n=1 Tax=Naegleria lovaniensis TaxID=51637 RepID=A0AA88GCR5_NAELO|nr:uncharacterized protein C9374_010154 [Naegleria lovaniensis]KAG2375150.1 hypothetical protein C9374_010154 [Naegleria lovaniensis]